MAKVKGISGAVKKFNAWPATARIYLDRENNRVWCETFVGPKEGRFQRQKSCVSEIHNKETYDGENIKTSIEELEKKIELEFEEYE